MLSSQLIEFISETLMRPIFYLLVHNYVQSDQKENKPEQALKIIGHVVADSVQISVQCMAVDNLWSQTLLYNKSYLTNFRRWNYNCIFYYYYLIIEKIYKINKSNILHS
jgi:hypothetical protein